MAGILPRDQNHVTAAGFESSSTTDLVISGKINEATGRILVNNSAGGDVVGPASSTDNAFAVWNGTTGKLLKDSTILFSSSAPSIQFGGTTSSFPMIKRSSISLQARLADDSAFATITASTLTASSANIVANGIVLTTGASTIQGNILPNGDGVIRLYNAASNDFGRLQFGGTTSSFPAIKRSGTTIAFRLADDSADAPITAASLATVNGAISGGQMSTTAAEFRFASSTRINGGSVDGNLTLLNNASSSFGRINLGGTTSSFPAIKRNGAGIDFRLADDSGNANISANTVTANNVLSAPGGYTIVGNSIRYNYISNGIALLTNNNGTAGVSIDLTTDGTAKFRDRSNAADANITASAGTFSGNVNLRVTTVGSLGSAATTGAVAFVTDATATMAAGIGTVVAGGGANRVPVYADGTNWLIG